MRHLPLLLVALVACGHRPFLERGVSVPMRDGVVLRADVVRPRGAGRSPVLVYRTPYGLEEAREGYSIIGEAVARGYAVVLQDVRGRHASEGIFDPYRQEGRDGHDTIEWAAAQPWSDGRVGTFGLSYPGAAQWLAAVESPPHLLAMVPAMTFASPDRFFTFGGVFDLSWIGWTWNNIAPDARKRLGLRGPRTGADARESWPAFGPGLERHLPLATLPGLREAAPWLAEWMTRPPGDPGWDFARLRDRYDQVSAAVLNLSGWHDEAYGPHGALTNFTGLRESRRAAPDARTRVIIGPWTHGVEETGLCRAGDREFGAAARIDYDDTVLDWMDRHVRGIETGTGPESPVRVFVMGADRWRDAEDWPLPGARAASWWLSPDGRLVTEAPAGHQGFARRFVSDPLDPVIEPAPTTSGAYDLRALALRRDVLVFDSEPLRADLEVVGAIEAEIHLSSDAPDADLWVRLLDVAPDGTAFNLMSPGADVLRASFRNGEDPDGRLLPGRVHVLCLKHLLTGNLFRAGHRIRVVIAGSCFPLFSRNLQTGEAEAVSAVARRATLGIHCDASHPSRIVLPVIP